MPYAPQAIDDPGLAAKLAYDKACLRLNHNFDLSKMAAKSAACAISGSPLFDCHMCCRTAEFWRKLGGA